MNLCEAFKISRYATTPAHNGIIVSRCGEFGDDFGRMYFEPDGSGISTYRYIVSVSDLERNDWQPVTLEVKWAPVKPAPLEPSAITPEEVAIAIQLPENGL
jgi:hypothetical protein